MKTLTVSLRANIGDFTSKMAVAGGSAEAAAAKIGSTLTATDAKTQESLKKVSQASLLIGGAMLAGFGVAAKAAADFEKEMSGVRAVSNATAGEMSRLSTAAVDAGRDTVFSASEAARAQAELAKAGISTADILGGALRGSLDLAAAGQLDLGRAAEISAQAMNIFKLRGADVGHIADVLASGANKSAADVDDLGLALRQAGLVAAQTGLSLEETVGTLAAFSDRALVGSDAGTSLRTMLLRLSPQSKEAADLMEQLGFSAFNSSGQFIGMAGLAGELKDSLAGMSAEQRNAALSTLFGSDAIRGANVLFELGTHGVERYTDAVNDQGAASRMAAVQLDNLAGDLEQLAGSLETALIQSGSSANGVLRFFAQTATDTVNTLSALPAPLQAGAVGFAGVAGSALAAAGAVGLIVPKIAEGRRALEGLGRAGELASRGIGTLGKAAGYAGVIGTVVLALDALNSQLQRLQLGEANLAEMGRAVVDLGQEQKVAGELTKQFGQDLEGLGRSFRLAAGDTRAFRAFENILPGDAARKMRDARDDIDALDRTLAELVRGGHAAVAADAFRRITEELGRQGVPAGNAKRLLDDYTGALVESETQQKLTGKASDNLSGSIGDIPAAADEATAAVGRLTSELGDAVAAFVDPTDVYTKLFDEVKTSEQRLADERSGATDRVLDAERAAMAERSKMRSRVMEDERTALDRRHQAEREVLQEEVGNNREAAAARRDILESQQRAEKQAFEDRKRRIDRDLEDERAALAARTEAVKRQAEEERKAREKADLKPSLRQAAEALEKANQEQEDWQRNLVKVAQRVGPEVAESLALMGEKGAHLVAEMATGTDEEVQRMAAALRRETQLGGEAAVANIETAMRRLPAIAAAGGSELVQNLVRELTLGKITLGEIIRDYGDIIGNGLNLIIRVGGGNMEVEPGVFRQYTPGTGFTGPKMMAEGGIVSRSAARPGVLTMPTILAGEGRGAESYIPHDPSYRSTAVPVLHDTARALGFRAVPMAKGGMALPAMPAMPVGGAAVAEQIAAAVAREMAKVSSSSVEVTQNNDFRGGDVPTAADMAYANRALGWQLLVATGRR